MNKSQHLLTVNLKAKLISIFFIVLLVTCIQVLVPTAQAAGSNPTIDLYPTQNTVDSGQSTKLIWSSENTSSCVATGGWTNNTSISGQQLIGPLNSTQKYTMVCTGSGGSASRSVIVTVKGDNQAQTSSNQPTLSISASRSSIDSGQSAIIAWDSTKTISCSASGNWTSRKNPIGQQFLDNITQTKTYSISCGGPYGSISKSVTIKVNGDTEEPTSGAPTLSITANKNNIGQGESTIISWTSTKTTYCSATGNWTNRKNPIGQQFLSDLSETKTYRITCTGPGGSVSKTVTVNVRGSSNTANPTLNITASPNNINEGQSSVITWSSTNTDTCAAPGGWTNRTSSTGTENIGPLSNTKEFRITCIKDGIGISRSVLVTVTVDTTPNTNGSAELRWLAPTTNKDGTPLTDLVSYKIYHGVSQSNLNSNIDIDAGFTNYIIENLPSGTHYFSMSAVDINGNESTRSNIAAKVVN